MNKQKESISATMSREEAPAAVLDAPDAGARPSPRPPRRRRAAWWFKLAAVLLAVLPALVLGEGLLRLLGFRYPLCVDQVDFGAPKRVEIDGPQWRADAQRFWVRLDYADRLTRIRRPDVVFMGCSCTQFGEYDRALEDLVKTRFPGRAFSYVNLGHLGWTSYQGLQQLKLDVLKLRPKLVTVFYGWNDHWVGFGAEDKVVVQLTNNRLLFALRNVRLVQLMEKVWLGFRYFGKKGYPERVSVEDFKANLTAMARLTREAGIRMVLITAPAGYIKGQENKWGQLRGRWLTVRPMSELLPLHERYVEAVREVARREGVPLCDAYAEFDRRFSREEASVKLFWRDAIHLKRAGSRLLAETLYDAIQGAGFLEPLLRPAGEAREYPGDALPDNVED